MTIQEILRSFVSYYENLSEQDPRELKTLENKDIQAILSPNFADVAYQEAVRVLHTEEINCKVCKYGDASNYKSNQRPNVCSVCGMGKGDNPLQWEHV